MKTSILRSAFIPTGFQQTLGRKDFILTQLLFMLWMVPFLFIVGPHINEVMATNESGINRLLITLFIVGSCLYILAISTMIIIKRLNDIGVGWIALVAVTLTSILLDTSPVIPEAVGELLAIAWCLFLLFWPSKG